MNGGTIKEIMSVRNGMIELLRVGMCNDPRGFRAMQVQEAASEDVPEEDLPLLLAMQALLREGKPLDMGGASYHLPEPVHEWCKRWSKMEEEADEQTRLCMQMRKNKRDQMIEDKIV